MESAERQKSARSLAYADYRHQSCQSRLWISGQPKAFTEFKRVTLRNFFGMSIIRANPKRADHCSFASQEGTETPLESHPWSLASCMGQTPVDQLRLCRITASACDRSFVGVYAKLDRYPANNRRPWGAFVLGEPGVAP